MKTARHLRSTTFRLALLYMLIFGGSVAVLLGFLYWATVGVLSEQMDETIQADITGLAEQYERRGTPGIAAIIGERVRKDPARRTVYLLTDPLRRPLVGNLDSWPPVEPDEGGWIAFELVDRAAPDGKPHLARAKRFVLQGGLNLLVGREVRELERTRRMIVNAMIWGIAITLALAFGGGIAMSRSTARRIDVINQTSHDIMSGNLEQRIPAGGAGDEFDQLAENLNAMLDRIQALMDGLRHVSDNIAHDLRTPLTRLRGRLEDLRDPDMTPSDRIHRIDATIAEADTLLSMFNALLRITQIEAGARRDSFTTVDLAELLCDVAELYEPVALEKGLVFSSHVNDAGIVSADRDLLFQSVANLADNAIKYTPAGGSVTMHVAGKLITVSDTGPGVPKDAREDVFRRFHRLEESRGEPGSGLGLSLVKAVAQLHGGDVQLEDNRPGLKFLFTVS